MNWREEKTMWRKRKLLQIREKRGKKRTLEEETKQRKKQDREEGENEEQGLYDYSALQASTKMGAFTCIYGDC